jgi:hypothetical protein
MQFPRGRFTAIKKGTRICDLIGELKHSRFSGYCIIARGAETGSLVLKNGNCLLAGYQDLAGDRAWIAIQHMEESEVDAQLMHLTPAQLDLAIEFNPGARIERRIKHSHKEKTGVDTVHGTEEGQKSQKGIPEIRSSPELPVKETGSAVRTTHGGPAAHRRTPPVKAGISAEKDRSPQPVTGGEPVPDEHGRTLESGTGAEISPVLPDVEIHARSHPEISTPGIPEKPLPGAETARESPVPPVPGKSAAGLDGKEHPGLPGDTLPAGVEGEEKSPNASFIRELAALDAMDLESMSEKIRINCRTIVQGLHLEHLIDEKEDKT